MRRAEFEHQARAPVGVNVESVGKPIEGCFWSNPPKCDRLERATFNDRRLGRGQAPPENAVADFSYRLVSLQGIAKVVFGLFKGKRHSSEPPKEIYFKSNEAAFEYAERFMPSRFVKGKTLIGLVLTRHKVHSRILLGPTHPTYTVKLAAESGTVEVSNCGSIAESLAANTKIGDVRIEQGDLVVVEVSEYDPKLPVGDSANYFLIIAKLMPVLSVSDHMFRVYRPDESK